MDSESLDDGSKTMYIALGRSVAHSVGQSVGQFDVGPADGVPTSGVVDLGYISSSGGQFFGAVDSPGESLPFYRVKPAG